MNNRGPKTYLSWYINGLKWLTMSNLYKEKYLLLTLRKPPEFIPKTHRYKGTRSCWFTFSSFGILTSLSKSAPLFSCHAAFKRWPTACSTKNLCSFSAISTSTHWPTKQKNSHHGNWGNATSYPKSQVPAILWPNKSSSPLRNPSLHPSSCLK